MKHAPFRTLLSACAFVLAAAAGAVHAQDKLPAEPNGFTWGELSLLPDYCKDTQGTIYQVQGNGQDSPRAPYWVGLMGPDFWHMHHYCYGQVAMLRAGQPQMTPVDKKRQYTRAVNEYGYVIRNASPTTALMPEVFYKLGEAHLALENVGAAQSAFARSRDLRPEYWPAYTRWADVLIGIKQRDQALALVREGLRHAPEAPELLKREVQLAGANSRPAVQRKAAVAATAATVAAAASAPTAPAPAPAPATPEVSAAPVPPTAAAK
jgi:tetratricopeptide (TPR) repeat protein